MTDEERTLEAEALIGDDADQFLNSDLGKVVMGLAFQEAEEAIEKLKSVDPTDVEQVRKLQNAIWRAESFEGWLKGLVREGAQALKSLEFDEGSHE